MHLNNTTLYLVVLTCLWQLQQCFLEKTEYKPARDWNKYGRYCSTPSKVAAGHPMLSNINMSTVNRVRSNIVLEVYYFKLNTDRTDVVTSLEEWAARLLKPDVTLILTEAEKLTIQRQGLLVQNNHLSLPSLKGNYKTTGTDDCDNQPTFNTSLDRQRNKTDEELLLNISTSIKNALMSAQKKKINSKKLKHGEVSKVETAHDAVSSLIALVNRTSHNNFRNFDEMHDHLQKQSELSKKKKKKWRSGLKDKESEHADSSEESSSDGSQEDKNSELKKRKCEHSSLGKLQCNMTAVYDCVIFLF
jgi:hypothetical protein